jgi:hypothetical protein
MVLAASGQRGKGFGKEEGIDFIGCQLAILDGVQEVHVGPAARTEGFHGQGMATALAEVMEQEASEQRFPDTSVGTGDEDNVRRARSAHSVRHSSFAAMASLRRKSSRFRAS